MNTFSLLFTIILLSLSLVIKAQTGSLENAFNNYKQGNLKEAQREIDELVKDNQLSMDAKTWYIRGFIYKALYKQDKKADSLLTLRLEAVSSFKKLLELDTSKKYISDGIKNLSYLAKTFFNDAIVTLDRNRFELSKKDFDHYKKIMKFIDPSMDLQNKEIEYYLSLSSAYSEAYVSNPTIKEYFSNAKSGFGKVLKLDPKNLKANYNMGVLFYNEAVTIISDLDYDKESLESFKVIEDKTIVLFKQSLPFMEIAHERDPADKNTLEGLSGIYFSLREFEKSDVYRKKLESLEK